MKCMSIVFPLMFAVNVRYYHVRFSDQEVPT